MTTYFCFIIIIIDNTSNDQQSNENSTEHPLCDVHADNQSINSNYSNKLTVNSDLIQTIKQRILNKYINVSFLL